MNHRPSQSIQKYYLYTLFTQLRFTRIVNVIFLVHFLKFSLVQFAALQSLFLFSQFAFEIPSGVLSDLFKKKSVIAIGLFLLILSPLLMTSVNLTNHSLGFAVIVFAFILEGVGNALLSGADDALFFEAIRRDGLEKAYAKIRGRIQLISAIVTGIATFIGGYLYSLNEMSPYFFQAFMLLGAGGVIVSMKEEKSTVESVRVSSQYEKVKDILLVFDEVRRSANVLFLVVFTTLVVAMVNAIFSLLPSYVSDLGFTSSANGTIFMIFSFVGGFVATQAFRLTKVSYRTLSLIIIGLLSVGMILQVQSNAYIFLIGACLLYVTVDILDPIVMEMLNLWVKDSARATLISGLSFAVSLVTMIVNPLIGIVIQQWGTVLMLTVFSFFTVVMIAISYILIFRTSKGKRD
ncbi:MFS transporter [Lacticaseibacillus zeae]|uniref:MFS transporter n=1 Tax=Lacticaseibacillus zeae TaxID=57037 RepID=UPI0008A17486|nr:MFS transporter [Lacticaseibacillus zeae]OFR90415.1 transporter [Lactobacillus sp. HMSC068F07]